MNEENDPILSYPRLGLRTFLMFAFRRSGPFVGVAFAGIILFVGLPFIPVIIPAIYVVSVLGGLVLMAALILLLTFFLAWLQYIHYSIYINEGNVRVTEGLLSTVESGFPYLRIKEIRIDRDIADQVLGVSSLFIVVTGASNDASDTICLPSLNKNIAIAIRNEILKRAQIEDVHVESHF